MSAILDNVPDCPELLNQKNVVSLSSIQLGGYLTNAIIPFSFGGACFAPSQFLLDDQILPAIRELLPTSRIAPSLPQAADSSPPLV